MTYCVKYKLRDSEIKNRIDPFLQQLATLLNWHMLNHTTTWCSSFVSNGCWDSVYSADTVFHSHRILFVENIHW